MILHGDALTMLKTLPDESVQCCVTSPPYWGLRDYGVAGQLGLEKTPEEYVAKMVDVFREVRRVLRSDGVLWLNLGDSYASGKGSCFNPGGGAKSFQDHLKKNSVLNLERLNKSDLDEIGLKPKDLAGIPWRVAFALQADGWWLRQDIIWCLSGGTYVYARTQKGDMPIMIRDVARLDPKTVRLWTGQQWTQVLGWTKSDRTGEEIQLTLRSGERISCTAYHRFPVEDWPDDKQAQHLCVGMKLKRTVLPEPASPRDSRFIGVDAAWFAGLYLAEGSRSEDTIQIAGHRKEEQRWVRVKNFAESYGGSATRTLSGNNMSIRVYGKIPNAIIDLLVSGRTAKDKCFSPVCWRYSNAFLRQMLDGYLSGDGGWEPKNGRWRLGFTRNYNLERDMRTLATRLDFHLVLNLSTVKYKGKDRPTFRGEIRFERSGHWNQKNPNEIVAIQKAKCREVYDIGVEDEPHLFALASGILTHNSKPNPMPESVTDRCTKSHEYIFLLTKSARYYYDSEAVKEKSNGVWTADDFDITESKRGDMVSQGIVTRGHAPTGDAPERYNRNRRSVWSITTKPFSGAHFATFPPEIPEICIKAGTSEKGCCAKCGSPWKRMTYTIKIGRGETESKLEDGIHERSSALILAQKRQAYRAMGSEGPPPTKTTGWQPTCDCSSDIIPCTVLDPFAGSGTTLEVAKRLGRDFIGIELNGKYIKDLIEPRLANINPLFSVPHS